jgi:multidrug transporter EmrE-like cation transporter
MWRYFGLLLLFEIIADYFTKKYSLKPGLMLWCAAIAGYILANACWLTAMKRGINLSRGSVLFGTAQAVLACIIGIGFFHEPVTRQQWVGLALGVAAIFLLIAG